MQPYLALITPLTGDPGVPAHPIVIPPPGVPAHPIVVPPPGMPAHPIYNPPPGTPEHPIAYPPPGVPAHPIYYPPVDLHPEHPIVLPPEPPPGEQPPTGPLGKMSWHTVWAEDYGWAVIGVPADAHVTPSKRR